MQMVKRMTPDEPTATRDNSLRIDLCINTVVKTDGQLPAIFINDVTQWIKIIGELEKELSKYVAVEPELTPDQIEAAKAAILNRNRADAAKLEHKKENDRERQMGHINTVWENANRRPENVAIGGPVDPRKKRKG